jgi:molybdate transport system substrate-binding protein
VASQIRVISSMATRQLLGDLVADYIAVTPSPPVSVESVGGVDAAKRVRAGEAFDVVVLAAETIAQLAEAGHLVAASRVDLVHSGVAIAVRAGAPRPPIGNEAEVRDAVAAARSIGYSTGPSGTHLARLFERWGIADAIAARIVQAPPGVPVASLIEQGKAELGFQQLSELMHAPGIDVVGPLPPEIQIVTTFSAARTAVSTQPEAVDALLAFLGSPAATPVKRRHGMEPAD